MSQKTICLVYNTTKYLYLHRLSLLRTLLEMGYKVYVIAPVDIYSVKISWTIRARDVSPVTPLMIPGSLGVQRSYLGRPMWRVPNLAG